ncbi:hypothetical protein V5P93_003938 [Actinokineospora auranticolor]|uniref:Uncharacterized protein n=1 Tax=Actinokineospora auranticolor TaxID=155976 RepID=A0A2S6GM13_9PSEU|nr:hypothetical protein [Actinokineospora auranticolor]PPK66220.1 hypothetical protein CLV40_111184 [Actinokineospora auranticolor]
MAYFGLDAVIDTATSVFVNCEPGLIEDRGHQLLVGGEGESKARRCTVEVALTTRRFGDAKVVVINAAKMPFIARNIQLA